MLGPALALAAALLAAPPASAQTAEELAIYRGSDRQQRLLDGARREGELLIYSSMQHESILPLQKAFEQKYSLKVRIWRGSGKDILRRVTGEAKGSRFELDIVESDGFALEALHREQLLQYVHSPYLADMIPQALRPHGEWVGTRINVFTSAYNTNLMKPPLPTRYESLLDPRYKGALGIDGDDYDWFGMVVGLLGEERGLKVFRDIVATNGISVRKGHTLLTNLVAAGEVPLALTVYMQNVEVAKKRGAPIQWRMIPPIVARANGVALARRAPHPHAAILFYDFLLGDGQEIMLQREFTPASNKIQTIANTIKLNFVDPAIVLDNGARWHKLYGDIIRSGGR